MIWDELKYDGQGLIPAIIQDVESDQVLMLAYMNQESLHRTLETGYTCFYSRSRQELWEKGAASGNRQAVREIYLDCDGDCLLIKVEQTGGACHLGYRSCFYRKLIDGQWKIVAEKVFEPEEVYSKPED